MHSCANYEKLDPEKRQKIIEMPPFFPHFNHVIWLLLFNEFFMLWYAWNSTFVFFFIFSSFFTRCMQFSSLFFWFWLHNFYCALLGRKMSLKKEKNDEIFNRFSRLTLSRKSFLSYHCSFYANNGLQLFLKYLSLLYSHKMTIVHYWKEIFFFNCGF